MDYQTFLDSKIQVVADAGFDVNPAFLSPALFEHQRDTVTNGAANDGDIVRG